MIGLSRFVHLRLQGAPIDAPVYNRKGGGKPPPPDPKIGEAYERLSKLAEQQWDTFMQEIWPEIRASQAKADTRADEQWEMSRRIGERLEQEAIEDRTRYKETFEPLIDEAVEEARRFNTAEEQERQAALSMGDVTAAFDRNRQAQEMMMRSYGIDPTSGVAMGVNNSSGAMEAAMRAAAATRARTAAEQLGWAKRADAIAMGQGLPAQSVANTQLALGAGQQAAAIGSLPFQNQLTAAGALTGAQSNRMAGWQASGNLALQQYQSQLDAWRAQQQARAQEAAGWGSALGSIGGALIFTKL